MSAGRLTMICDGEIVDAGTYTNLEITVEDDGLKPKIALAKPSRMRTTSIFGRTKACPVVVDRGLAGLKESSALSSQALLSDGVRYPKMPRQGCTFMSLWALEQWARANR